MSSRSVPAEPHGLSVVLVHPEIPPNTGNIGRLCAATDTPLHLIEPLGFSLEDRYLRRAGLDYWPYLSLATHSSWTDYAAAAPPATRVHFSARASATFLDAPFEAPRVELVFGCETKGLPDEVLENAGERIYRIPISQPAVRSLNLANAVAIVLYEALRQRNRLV